MRFKIKEFLSNNNSAFEKCKFIGKEKQTGFMWYDVDKSDLFGYFFNANLRLNVNIPVVLNIFDYLNSLNIGILCRGINITTLV